MENGRPPKTPRHFEFGYPTANDILSKMNAEIQRAWEDSPDIASSAFSPDWSAQTLRSVVPCVGTDRYEWRRTGQVVTLGELFMALGKKWDARSIYSFFRTLRVVATKRAKACQGKFALCQYK